MSSRTQKSDGSLLVRRQTLGRMVDIFSEHHAIDSGSFRIVLIFDRVRCVLIFEQYRSAERFDLHANAECRNQHLRLDASQRFSSAPLHK